MRKWLAYLVVLTALAFPTHTFAQAENVVFLPALGQQSAPDAEPPAEPEPTTPATPAPTDTLTPPPSETLTPEPTDTLTPEPPPPSETPIPPGTPTITPDTLAVSGALRVHFIDVGQGDATLLDGPDFTFLIDAGRHDRNDVVPYLEQVGVDALDLLVGTHPHADHIGQMDQVLEAWPVGEVWMSGDEHTTLTYERVIDAIADSDAAYHEPRAGEVYDIGAAVVEVLHPDALTGDFHEGSIILRVVFDGIAFLFTGDAEAQTELKVIQDGYTLASHVLQVGHHGSNTSSTQPFLDAVNPHLAIWSAGVENQYGHPHAETMQRYADMHIETHGTADCGTIVVTVVALSLWLDATNSDCGYMRLAAHVQIGLTAQSADLRAGPDAGATLVESLAANTALWALGMNDASDWTLIRSEAGAVGWLPSHTVDAVETHTLPVIVAPPTTPPPPPPTPTETVEPPPTETPTGTPTPVVECVNINTASWEALQEIVHIGPDRATELIELRPFASVDDMTRISGIGPARLADIKAQGLACV